MEYRLEWATAAILDRGAGSERGYVLNVYLEDHYVLIERVNGE